MIDVSDDARFWRHVRRTEGCWFWQGSQNGRGYGKLGRQGKMYLAHRVAFFSEYGWCPRELDHICNERSCVRPNHLQPTSHRLNVLRSAGISALAARVTHCPRGHPYTGGNVKYERDGSRKCRTCANAVARAWRQKQKAAAR